MTLLTLGWIVRAPAVLRKSWNGAPANQRTPTLGRRELWTCREEALLADRFADAAAQDSDADGADGQQPEEAP